jgi:hypothetical protein
VFEKSIDLVATSSTNSLQESVPDGLTKTSEINSDCADTDTLDTGPNKKIKPAARKVLNRVFMVISLRKLQVANESYFKQNLNYHEHAYFID